MKQLCEYGCGNMAEFVMTSGKNCCSEKYQQCPKIKEKNSIGVKKIHANGDMYLFDNKDRVKSNEKKIEASIEKAFVEDSSYSNEFIKPKFIELYAEDYKCSSCDIDSWNGKPIVLELDHIDGNNRNNLPTNLRLLCPNCHSQTPTFRGRNINNGLNKVTDDMLVAAIKDCPNTRSALIKVGLSPKGGNYDRVKRLKKFYNL